ncbi:2-dehydro-3-deoxygluconokinase [Amycolatopsis oliviviridis]|uniref:2-dehydro-3-deoxygluconokinase n=1 Tax=Amycolatopsis oliviviridis TaxID=1471590 RepID=A0ABQ3LFN1_9PSEU|nr:sugar kinase [Amycolatopsis oliviviridis]GHH14745.1 2-dehydro-3-deoxygluconokinase [Amycolatopsis oliviviridis]
MIDVLTFGETMASLRATGPLNLGGVLRSSIAGAESNVAIGLARLGHTVRWAGLVGEDGFGALVERTLRAEGVDLNHLWRVGTAPTGLVVFEPRVADVVRVTYHRDGSAGSRLTPGHVEAALAEGARIVHLTGITAALGPEPRSAVELACRAPVVCLDVNHRAKLWSAEQAADVLRPLVPRVTILVASEEELPIVAPGVSESDQVKAILGQGVREVVVKRGSRGAEVFTVDGSVRADAVPVRSVDAVGAGDAFVAGYLSGLLDGDPVEWRLERAATLGAFAVASSGDWEGLPTRNELGLLGLAPGTAVR